MAKVKPHNGGKWTEARKKSFIVGALRRASSRWGPKNDAKGKARVRRGEYECALCKTLGPATLPPEEGKKRRRNNAAADHINPVVDPRIGFVDWNTFIERLFCEVDGFQILCHECHTVVTKEERMIAKERRDKEKVDG